MAKENREDILYTVACGRITGDGEGGGVRGREGREEGTEEGEIGGVRGREKGGED